MQLISVVQRGHMPTFLDRRKNAADEKRHFFYLKIDEKKIVGNYSSTVTEVITTSSVGTS